MYLSGKTLKQVGAAYGITSARVQQLLTKANVPRRKKVATFEEPAARRYQARKRKELREAKAASDQATLDHLASLLLLPDGRRGDVDDRLSERILTEARRLQQEHELTDAEALAIARSRMLEGTNALEVRNDEIAEGNQEDSFSDW